MISDIPRGLSPYDMERAFKNFEIINLRSGQLPALVVLPGARCWEYDWCFGLQPMKKYDHKEPGLSIVYLKADFISWQHLLTGCAMLTGAKMNLDKQGIKSELYLVTIDAEDTALCLIEGGMQ